MTFHTEISQVSTTDRVNVNQLGHYTLHYTAPTDAAGNTGPTIIQIVEVLDAPPIDITLSLYETVAIAPLYTLKQEMTYLYNYR